ncbi:Spy/CpxP family protein refolding chaperone [Aporhodopirellula aestuarii]|uniref:Beta-agarase n=1 Tax=Aporhodopirellula aestuarii TaxID=2950107 RepID=A0ABT0TWS8_9BACT|nr:beta-agarase [Aporhodopirellula aestuarii]MCM2369077.1 beta-agarase [Aporhodopirellula aestuarii]
MKTITLILISVVALSSAGAADDPPNAESTSRQDKTFNARMEPFLKELNLSEKQKPEFLAIQRAMTTKWAEFQKLPANERKPKQQAFYQARFEELDQLLTPEQMAKYRAIRAGGTAGTNATGREKRLPNIRLTRIDGRHWLVGPDGKPFFAHGITHVSNNRAKFDFAEMSAACQKLGFNSYGYGCPDQLRHDMPYIESWNHLVPISYYRGENGVKFIDVFDPKEQARLEAGVKANCFRSLSHPHHVIGYCWTDLGSWPLDNPSGRNWVDFIRGLPEESPGQKAYQKYLSTWEGGDDKSRDQAFLRLIAREYFRVVGGAQRKYDPDHLIFGDRFDFNTFDSDVVKEMLPYIDGVAIQPPFRAPFPKEKLDEIHKLTGKPILLCDFAIRFKDGDKDIRSWKAEENSVVAGKAYSDYVKAAINTDYIIGVFWCNPVDTPKGFGNPGVKQGFFDDGLAERPGLHQAVKELNAYRENMTPKELE